MALVYSYKIIQVMWLGKIKPWTVSSVTSGEMPLSANNITETLDPR